MSTDKVLRKRNNVSRKGALKRVTKQLTTVNDGQIYSNFSPPLLEDEKMKLVHVTENKNEGLLY